jgi:RES domain-containing protein
MLLWRISDHADLSGRGGLLSAGRWHSIGRPVIYTAESSAGALNELLVHMDRKFLAPDFQLIGIGAPDTLERTAIETLPDGWKNDVRATREIGDRWLASGTSALLRVPSAIIAHSYNVLINPQHASAAEIGIESIERLELDPRFHGGPSARR